jgi:uncharacterized protein DUF5979
MRRIGRAMLGLLVLMSGPVAIAMTASPASGGTNGTLTVTKTVDGTAPPGAQFVVDIDCGDATATPSQMTFTGSGSQAAIVSSGGGSFDFTCTVVESATAGATVTYACDVTSNPDTATCQSDNSVQFEATPSAATITVTNSFPPPPSPPPEPGAAAAEPPPAEPVTAAAQFTG